MVQRNGVQSGKNHGNSVMEIIKSGTVVTRNPGCFLLKSVYNISESINELSSNAALHIVVLSVACGTDWNIRELHNVLRMVICLSFILEFVKSHFY